VSQLETVLKTKRSKEKVLEELKLLGGLAQKVELGG
jgi:hypothetical protein